MLLRFLRSLRSAKPDLRERRHHARHGTHRSALCRHGKRTLAAIVLDECHAGLRLQLSRSARLRPGTTLSIGVPNGLKVLWRTGRVAWWKASPTLPAGGYVGLSLPPCDTGGQERRRFRRFDRRMEVELEDGSRTWCQNISLHGMALAAGRAPGAVCRLRVGQEWVRGVVLDQGRVVFPSPPDFLAEWLQQAVEPREPNHETSH